MTVSIVRKRIIPVLAAAAALALAGCAATNVGDSWQCPLAQGKVCASVAAADPAVPEPAAGKPVPREPLYRARGAGDVSPTSGPACNSECGSFDPFAWLGRLFGAQAYNEGGERDEAPSASEPDFPAEAAAKSSASPDVPAADAGIEAAILPAHEAPVDGDLRTGEVVARIWIAPFVDAGGVYREASHVRIVLEPAGWRAP